jgi:hypothetical protein
MKAKNGSRESLTLTDGTEELAKIQHLSLVQIPECDE